ncbi:MAG: enoyl-CoA hydratase/isomerase family protein [Candidatus Kapabacteria bacterium]|nr:enoyl-CoA hydratase/isomerase family protein [Candidatus Kapabacteria bacterium]
MNYQTIELDIQNKVATIRLNRPDVHNALNNILIYDLYDAFESLLHQSDVRVIVLTGNGKSFCAGADLNWMKSVVHYSYEQNYEESLKLAKLMYLIFNHTKPVIAKINGSAIGGGVGLMSVCDILVANETAKFGLSEVRLGLVPAAISPFVMSRIGESHSRELFITGERISAAKALRIGLLNYCLSESELDSKVDELCKTIIKNGPNALKSVKELIFNCTQLRFPELQNYTAKLIADLRLSTEGQEGMNAFLEKREPNWV